MSNPYTPVERSTAKHHPRRYIPPESENTALKFHDGQDGRRLVVENSRNASAWVEAEDDESFVDLAAMR